MLQTKIALIDQTKKIRPAHLSAVAAALQTQVNRDVAQFWPVSASITTLDTDAKRPASVWPVYIVDSLPPGEGGYHWDTATGQPYSVVVNGAGWTVATSHEVIEMLIDPSGNRLQAGRNIVLTGIAQSLGTTTVDYLVEAADAPESHGYVIDTVAVSDFVTPAFYADAAGSARYDFMGRIKQPLEVLLGGYISWLDPATQHMMQLVWLDPSQPPSIADLGAVTAGMSLKQFVDSKTGTLARLASSADHPAVKLAAAMAKP